MFVFARLSFPVEMSGSLVAGFGDTPSKKFAAGFAVELLEGHGSARKQLLWMGDLLGRGSSLAPMLLQTWNQFGTATDEELRRIADGGTDEQRTAMWNPTDRSVEGRAQAALGTGVEL